MSRSSASGVVHLLAPAGYDDPSRASGGNRYDCEIAGGLGRLGWETVIHEVTQVWPAPDGGRVGDAVDRELALVPDNGLVLVDGLVAAAAARELVAHSTRLRLVLLVHMPGPPGGPPGEVLRSAALVVATSAATARSLETGHDLASGSVLVAAPGTSPAELAVGTTGGQRLLCVAAVTETKGQDRLVTALAGLGDRPWTLVCVGALDREPAYVDALRREVELHGLAGRVRFTGPLSGADLDRAYADADLLLLPSRQESYGLVVTEALARGLPVIASAVGGVSEAIGRTADGRLPGLLVTGSVTPGEPTGLGSALSRWLDDPELRAALRSAARRRRRELPGWEQPVGVVAAALTRTADVAFASAGAVNRVDPARVPLT